MSLNETTIIDDDDDRSDWIEIHNPTSAPVSLAGWHLTDVFDWPDQWPFPDIVLPANGYLVVFASGKDRRSPGAPLHTNFQLRREGDYLALVDPSWNAVTEFYPSYPEQKPDVSYGYGQEADDLTTLLDVGAPARALIPSDDSLGLTWKEVDYDDLSWQSGTTGVGYDYGALVGLDVGAMRYVNQTVYVRIPFVIDDLPIFDTLTLRLQYEDGMICYLNGQRIAEENAPESPTWNSGASQNRDDSLALSFVDIDITSALDLLRVGKNVLAFHGLNYLVGSTDLLIRPQLIGVVRQEEPEDLGYFLSPTPGERNGPVVPGVAGKAQFSVPSKTFSNGFTLELTLPDNAMEGAEIRYTTNRSVPTATSPLYESPLPITTTTQVRAKVYEPGGREGPTVSETYVGLESDTLSFSSNLPLMVLENFGAGWMSQSTYQPVFMGLFEPGTGRSALTAAPDVATRAAIRIRGSSTAGRPKPSLNLELWNEADDDKNMSLLGMPSESDWVLWGPYNFDLALMRNPLIYELSNQVGRYAVRTRFVEVFLNTGGGRVSAADYWGVYALEEKISRDEDRVDVEKLFPEHDRDPGITGGYMLKIDRPDPGDSGFYAAGQTLLYVYPKEVEIERPERDAQEQYIRNFFSQFGTALNGANYKDPELGYARYVDVDSWVDHHLLNVLPCNVDAFRLSGYMFKRRSAKLEMGPIWDFDRSMGSTDGRDANPNVWRGGGDGTDFFNYPWWGRMFTDIDFFQRYIDRWQELRRDQFTVANVHSVIDGMADEVREAQVRDLAKWGQYPRSAYGGTYQGEVDHLKDWLAQRIAFMDSQFVSAPVFTPMGGQITPGFSLTMWASNGSIYYTLDGSDPRAPGGGVSPTATLYTGPIPLAETTNVIARVYNPNHTSLTGTNNPPLSSKWSGVTRARFSIHALAGPGNIAITEMHYHPLEPTTAELAVNPDFDKDDFEFIELKNIGMNTIDLVGMKFTDGITFIFDELNTPFLGPGEFVLLVKDLEAFVARYGEVGNVAGEYVGNLRNGGETLCLKAISGETIVRYTYDDDWHVITDGTGFSLVAVDPYTSPDDWERQDAWRSSAYVNGSPGYDDPIPGNAPPIVVNEVLANTEVPEVDAIELFNPTDEDADIGGWYLSDDSRNPVKFRIPDGTVVRSKEYVAFDENDFNAASLPESSRFALSSVGEEAFLFSADVEGNLTGYMHGFKFGPTERGVSLGRHVISTGQTHFIRQIHASLNALNAGPAVGPIVINEIMYRAGTTQLDATLEFLELANISSEPVPLFDPASTSSTWRLEGTVEYSFPGGVTLDPGECALLVGIDPEGDVWTLISFLEYYGLDFGTTVYGPYGGTLEDSHGTITLLKPDSSILPGSAGTENVPYVVMDEVEYRNSYPWPDGADGTGKSLQRILDDAYGNDPLSWQAAPPTPKAANADGDADGDGLPNHWEAACGLNPWSAEGDDGASGDPDGDGLTNLDERDSGTNPRNSDSDEDGLGDLWEVQNALDPTDPTGDKGPDGDLDGDGLTNLDERDSGTNPRNPDSDEDGLGDLWEVQNALDPNDPTGDNGPDGDVDGDGLTNLDESNSGTNPRNSDTDEDGLGDLWEVQNALDPNDPTGDNGPDGDVDGDGLTNLDERDSGTNPRKPDSDEDGLGDLWEVQNSLDANDPTGDNGPDGDVDGDGLTNLDESNSGTNPRNPDSDEDGLGDLWEVQNGLDPNDPTGDNGPDGDPDGDGLTNLEEMLAGTDPNVDDSDFCIVSVQPNNPGVILIWQSRLGKRYQVHICERLDGEWLPLGEEMPGTGETMTFVDETADSLRTCFYRIVMLPVP